MSDRKFTPEEIVYLLKDGRWYEYTFINYTGWQDTVQLFNGLGGFSCKASELTPKEDYDKMIHEARREEIRKEMKSIIDLYGDGPAKPGTWAQTKHNKNIAKILGKEPRAVGQQVACLKRWGLIK